MMPSADFPCSAYQRLVLWEIHIPDHRCSDLTVAFHNLEFFICQSAWFIEDFFRNADLSNVMKGRCCYDQSNIRFCQMIRICFPDQFSQQHLRCDTDV